MASFDLHVSHRQLSVHAANLENPLSEWNGRHVAQGFVWRPHTVSFRTFVDGALAVTATREACAAASATASRIIQVPFEVSGNGLLKIVSGKSEKEIRIPPGAYDLRYALGLDAEGQWCSLCFTACSACAEPVVLRADAELHPATPLLMKAAATADD